MIGRGLGHTHTWDSGGGGRGGESKKGFVHHCEGPRLDGAWRQYRGHVLPCPSKCKRQSKLMVLQQPYRYISGQSKLMILQQPYNRNQNVLRVFVSVRYLWRERQKLLVQECREEQSVPLRSDRGRAVVTVRARQALPAGEARQAKDPATAKFVAHHLVDEGKST
jgi:hypothetical protein